MITRLKKSYARALGVALVAFIALVALLSAFAIPQLFAHPAIATRQNAAPQRGKISPSQSFTMPLGGVADWSTAPVVSESARAADAGAPFNEAEALTSAQRAAYTRSVKRGAIRSPFAEVHAAPVAGPTSAQIAQNAQNIANFDSCGYSINPCLTHSFAGQNSGMDGRYSVPDQALATNTAYVFVGNNDIFSVYNYSGATVYGPTSAADFFSPVYHTGDRLSHPQIVWDGTQTRWIVAELEVTADSSGNVTTGYYDFAVSRSQGPDLAPTKWYIYQKNITALLLEATSSWCDYPILGDDYWSIWLSCSLFTTGPNATFIGNTLFGLGKVPLYAGKTTSGVDIGDVRSDIPHKELFSISPAIEDGTPDGEFMIGTDSGLGGVYNAFTLIYVNATNNLNHNGFPALWYVVQPLPITYTDPIPAMQPASSGGQGGGTLTPGSGTGQVEYKGGDLYFAVTTAINGGAHDGIFWAEVQPQLTAGDVRFQQPTGAIVRQASIWADAGDAYTPTFTGTDEDSEVLAFDVSSATVYPSLAFVSRRDTDAPNEMEAGGAASVGVVFGANAVKGGRFGLYSACSLSPNLITRGLVWCAGEYAGPHTSPTGSGWDTWVYSLQS